ncbi:MAG TPA: hypothetical protein VKX96_02535 [Chloroflexota bacterium]|jgi:hypothetical protein|nr:hypothetical protein [Chloroflexota bacterium]
MRNNMVSLEELQALLREEGRDRKPLGRMPMQRWSLLSLWALRLYVVAMFLLFGVKFLQMAGIIG